MKRLDQILASTQALPASPEILPKLQRILREPDAEMAEVVALFKLDPNLTAQLIRLSNSAYYGSSQNCNCVEDAIQRVGFQEVYRLVAALTSIELLGEELPLYDIPAQDHWLYSLRCATLMRELARLIGLDEDDAYTIGLLHALGMVVIDRYHQEHGLDGIDDHQIPLDHDREMRLLGFDHAEVAAALMERWYFAPAITLPVRHQYEHTLAQEFKPYAYLLHLCKDAQEYMHSEPEHIAERLQSNPELLTELSLSQEEVIDATLDAQNSVEWLTSTL